MLNVTKELTALARKLGYTGKAPDTVAKAINAITASVGEGGGEGGGGCDCKTMVVHTALNDEDYIYITDVTAGELFALLEDEYIIFVSFSGEEDSIYISMITNAYSSNKGIGFRCAENSSFISESPNEHPYSPSPIVNN